MYPLNEHDNIAPQEHENTTPMMSDWIRWIRLDHSLRYQLKDVVKISQTPHVSLDDILAPFVTWKNETQLSRRDMNPGSGGKSGLFHFISVSKNGKVFNIL